jgi:sterol carrier protein 2
MSKGHPLGATGLVRCAELTWQLRGWAKNGRLVKKVDVVLQHNFGLGGAIVVTANKRADGRNNNAAVDDEEITKLSGLGYNPAIEARYITTVQAHSVMSKQARYNYALSNIVDLMTARF